MAGEPEVSSCGGRRTLMRVDVHKYVHTYRQFIRNMISVSTVEQGRSHCPPRSRRSPLPCPRPLHYIGHRKRHESGQHYLGRYLGTHLETPGARLLYLPRYPGTYLSKHRSRNRPSPPLPHHTYTQESHDDVQSTSKTPSPTNHIFCTVLYMYII